MMAETNMEIESGNENGPFWQKPKRKNLMAPKPPKASASTISRTASKKRALKQAPLNISSSKTSNSSSGNDSNISTTSGKGPKKMMSRTSQLRLGNSSSVSRNNSSHKVTGSHSAVSATRSNPKTLYKIVREDLIDVRSRSPNGGTKNNAVSNRKSRDHTPKHPPHHDCSVCYQKNCKSSVCKGIQQMTESNAKNVPKINPADDTEFIVKSLAQDAKNGYRFSEEPEKFVGIHDCVACGQKLKSSNGSLCQKCRDGFEKDSAFKGTPGEFKAYTKSINQSVNQLLNNVNQTTEGERRFLSTIPENIHKRNDPENTLHRYKTEMSLCHTDMEAKNRRNRSLSCDSGSVADDAEHAQLGSRRMVPDYKSHVNIPNPNNQPQTNMQGLHGIYGAHRMENVHTEGDFAKGSSTQENLSSDLFKVADTMNTLWKGLNIMLGTSDAGSIELSQFNEEGTPVDPPTNRKYWAGQSSLSPSSSTTSKNQTQAENEFIKENTEDTESSSSSCFSKKSTHPNRTLLTNKAGARRQEVDFRETDKPLAPCELNGTCARPSKLGNKTQGPVLPCELDGTCARPSKSANKSSKPLVPREQGSIPGRVPKSGKKNTARRVPFEIEGVSARVPRSKTADVLAQLDDLNPAMAFGHSREGVVGKLQDAVRHIARAVSIAGTPFFQGRTTSPSRHERSTTSDSRSPSVSPRAEHISRSRTRRRNYQPVIDGNHSTLRDNMHPKILIHEEFETAGDELRDPTHSNPFAELLGTEYNDDYCNQLECYNKALVRQLSPRSLAAAGVPTPAVTHREGDLFFICDGEAFDTKKTGTVLETATKELLAGDVSGIKRTEYSSDMIDTFVAYEDAEDDDNLWYRLEQSSYSSEANLIPRNVTHESKSSTSFQLASTIKASHSDAAMDRPQAIFESPCSRSVYCETDVDTGMVFHVPKRMSNKSRTTAYNDPSGDAFRDMFAVSGDVSTSDSSTSEINGPKSEVSEAVYTGGFLKASESSSQSSLSQGYLEFECESKEETESEHDVYTGTVFSFAENAEFMEGQTNESFKDGSTNNSSQSSIKKSQRRPRGRPRIDVILGSELSYMAEIMSRSDMELAPWILLNCSNNSSHSGYTTQWDQDRLTLENSESGDEQNNASAYTNYDPEMEPIYRDKKAKEKTLGLTLLDFSRYGVEETSNSGLFFGSPQTLDKSEDSMAGGPSLQVNKMKPPKPSNRKMPFPFWPSYCEFDSDDESYTNVISPKFKYDENNSNSTSVETDPGLNCNNNYFGDYTGDYGARQLPQGGYSQSAAANSPPYQSAPGYPAGNGYEQSYGGAAVFQASSSGQPQSYVGASQPYGGVYEQVNSGRSSSPFQTAEMNQRSPSPFHGFEPNKYDRYSAAPAGFVEAPRAESPPRRIRPAVEDGGYFGYSSAPPGQYNMGYGYDLQSASPVREPEKPKIKRVGGIVCRENVANNDDYAEDVNRDLMEADLPMSWVSYNHTDDSYPPNFAGGRPAGVGHFADHGDHQDYASHRLADDIGTQRNNWREQHENWERQRSPQPKSKKQDTKKKSRASSNQPKQEADSKSRDKSPTQKSTNDAKTPKKVSNRHSAGDTKKKTSKYKSPWELSDEIPEKALGKHTVRKTKAAPKELAGQTGPTVLDANVNSTNESGVVWSAITWVPSRVGGYVKTWF